MAWARIRASVKPPELNRYMTPCLAVTVFSQSNLELIARLAINVGLAKLNVTRGDRLAVIARIMESSANIKIFLLKSEFHKAAGSWNLGLNAYWSFYEQTRKIYAVAFRSYQSL